MACIEEEEDHEYLVVSARELDDAEITAVQAMIDETVTVRVADLHRAIDLALHRAA